MVPLHIAVVGGVNDEGVGGDFVDFVYDPSYLMVDEGVIAPKVSVFYFEGFFVAVKEVAGPEFLEFRLVFEFFVHVGGLWQNVIFVHRRIWLRAYEGMVGLVERDHQEEIFAAVIVEEI